jgi:hypothetical protein
MGACRLCGQKAGILKSEHQECVAKHDAGLSKLSSLALDSLLRLEKSLASPPDTTPPRARLDDELAYAVATATLAPVRKQLEEVRSSSFCSQQEKLAALVAAWRQGLERFTSEKYLSPSESASLVGYKIFFEIPSAILIESGDLAAFSCFSHVSEIQRGGIPDRWPQELPFIFERGETPFWRGIDIGLAQNRTTRSYEGGSGGLSIRVAPGLYTRVGAFRGHPIEATSVQLIDVGEMVLTDRQIYFSGPKVTLKIRYGSIVAFEALEDGIGVRMEGGPAKIFAVGEQWKRPGLIGWYLHSVISLLCQRAAK